MKYLLLSVLIFLSDTVIGQKESFNIPFEFKLIDSIPGISKDLLFIKTKEWITKNSLIIKKIEFEDKEAGKILSKGKFNLPKQIGNYEDPVSFLMTLDFKDGKYRCVLSDFFQEDGGGDMNFEKPHSWISITKKWWLKEHEMAEKKANEILKSLKEYLRKGSEDF